MIQRSGVSEARSKVLRTLARVSMGDSASDRPGVSGIGADTSLSIRHNVNDPVGGCNINVAPCPGCLVAGIAPRHGWMPPRCKAPGYRQNRLA